MRVAVVGHTEWVEFARVPRTPRAGDIVHAPEVWFEPAGGGAVAAAELARLAGRSHFFTALGDDAVAAQTRERLGALGVEVQALTEPGPSARAFTLLDDAGERTIVVLGRKLRPSGASVLPWERLAEFDGVYFASGDVAALRHARRARVLVTTARVLEVIRRADVTVDALVRSSSDEGERYQSGDLARPPKLVVTTEGGNGGTFTYESGLPARFAAVPLDGPIRDAYGAGDSFAAGLTWALASGLTPPEALAVAARSGAAALQRVGAHGFTPLRSHA